MSHSNKKNEKEIKEQSEELANEQKQEQPELHHLPTEGKAPGELKDFEKSKSNVDKAKE